MTSHPEYRAHLAGILAEPEDDLRRLVLADWLEERATSVLDCDGVDGKHSHGGKAGSVIHGEYHEGDPRKAHHHHDHKCPRRSNGFAERAEFVRESVTRPSMWAQAEVYPGGRWHIAGRDHKPDLAVALEASLPHPAPTGVVARFNRGFVAHVRVPTLAAWLGGECQFCGGQGRSFFHPNWHQTDCTMCHATGRVGGIGRAVCATQPVERVEVADLEPRLVSDSLGDGWTWSRATSRPADRHTIPNEVRRLLPFDHVMPLPRSRGYVRWESPSAARAALSAALISLARAESPLAVSDRNGTMSGL